jgi:hypothetical protein
MGKGRSLGNAPPRAARDGGGTGAPPRAGEPPAPQAQPLPGAARDGGVTRKAVLEVAAALVAAKVAAAALAPPR